MGKMKKQTKPKVVSEIINEPAIDEIDEAFNTELQNIGEMSQEKRSSIIKNLNQYFDALRDKK